MSVNLISRFESWDLPHIAEAELGDLLKITDPVKWNHLMSQLKALLVIETQPRTMSKLPDGGAKIRNRIEKLRRQLSVPKSTPVKKTIGKPKRKSIKVEIPVKKTVTSIFDIDWLFDLPFSNFGFSLDWWGVGLKGKKKQFFSELPFQFLEKKIHLIDGSAPKNPQKYWIEILNIYRNIEYWILDIYRNIEYWILDIYRNIEYGIYIEILNMEYISKYWILNVYQNIEYWICSSIAPELFKKCSDTTSGHIPPRKGLCAAACVNTCLKLGPCALRMPHWHWTFNYVLLTVPARTAVPAL